MVTSRRNKPSTLLIVDFLFPLFWAGNEKTTQLHTHYRSPFNRRQHQHTRRAHEIDDDRSRKREKKEGEEEEEERRQRKSELLIHCVAPPNAIFIPTIPAHTLSETLKSTEQEKPRKKEK
jgi:hypothetical protein